MHLTDGQIRAYQDHEVEAAERERIRAHLEACPTCRQLAEARQERAAQVARRLAALAPLPHQAPASPAAGRARLQAYISQKEVNSMSNRIFGRQARPAWAAIGLIALLALALVFPQVRAAANSFLGLFRVEQITVVSFDEQVLDQRFNTANQLGLFSDKDVQVEKIGESRTGVDLAEASALVGIPVRLPATAILDQPSLDIMAGERTTFQIDRDRLNALLHQLGVTGVEIPRQADGELVVLEIYPGLVASYGDCAQGSGYDPDDPYNSSYRTHCTRFVQMPSPTVSAPPGLDIAGLGEAMLQLLGMSPEEAAQFSQTVDWTTTLVLPLPSGQNTYQEVPVDGVQGIWNKYYTHRSGARIENNQLLWVKDGIVYALETVGWTPNIWEITASLE